MASGTSSGNFKISDAPVESSSVARPAERPDPPELPSHYAAPMVLLIPRNPRTLFVCWSVDWASAFSGDLPTDRKAHLKLTSHTTERTHPVEPMTGYTFVTELEPGETYKIEIGYYFPANNWRSIASDEVTMPLAGAEVETVDVATIPFHLSFQRLTELFGGHISLAQSLAAFESRMAKDCVRTEDDEKLLRELRLSLGDLEFAEAIREALRKSKTRPRAAEHSFASSFPCSGGLRLPTRLKFS